MKITLPFIFFILLSLFSTFPHTDSFALPRSSTDMPVEDSVSKPSSRFSLLKNKTVDFFPVPVFETRPDEGESYGLMPVVLFSERDSKAIQLILAAIGQYNSITKVSGAAVVYFFPKPVEQPDEVVEFYFELAQRYYRETTLRYFSPHFRERVFLEARAQWLKTPFRRFYGYGARSAKADESNFTSRQFALDLTVGRYLSRFVRVNFGEHFLTTDLLTRAFPGVSDTLTRYGAQPGVADTTNLMHELSLSYDSREHGENSKRGIFAELGYFFSNKSLGSDSDFYGFRLEGIWLKPWLKERMVTAVRSSLRDVYGDAVPFYHQSSLGGDRELRSFIPDRFTDNGAWVLAVEQRVRVLKKKIFGIPVEFHADPFVEVGRVFDNLNHFSLTRLQPVVGLGLRGVVPPNVVGRLDVAIGREGYNVYTMLGYPF